MFGLGKASFVDEDFDAWSFEAWAWLMRHLGGMDRLRQSPLVLPNRDFFPPTEAKGQAKARYVFERVRGLMGMADWPCELEAVQRPRQSAQVSEYVFINTPGKSAAGTFQTSDGGAKIRYASDLLDQPANLIATFSHELCHYLLLPIAEPVPGGPEAEELMTDLAVAYVGFGLFGMNSAPRLRAHGDAFGQGYRYGEAGYLSERGWALALATFLALKGDTDLPQLKDQATQVNLKAALKFIAKRPSLLETLRALP